MGRPSCLVTDPGPRNLHKLSSYTLTVADEMEPFYNAFGKHGPAHVRRRNGRNHINGIRREGREGEALPFH